MAEWIPSALSNLANRLTTLVIQTPESSSSSSSTQLSSINEDINFLRRTWPRIQAVLADAEDMEIVKESVRRWLDDLRDLAYDAEDVLDEYEYELVPKRSRDNKVGLSETSSVVKSSFLDGVAKKVGDIRRRLDEIAIQREGLQLREEDGNRRFEIPRRPPSTHMIREARVFGRDKNREDLIHLLLSPSSDDGSDDDIAVIALVGMGGVGKTTLAQLVFNDPRVQGKFGARGWIHASEDFDLCKLTNSAIESLTLVYTYLTELSTLQEDLERKLSGRKFLFVVDNVWNKSVERWDTFMAPFRHGGAKGSRILITTRMRHVAEVTRPIAIYHLYPLFENDCWEVFKHHAFNGLSLPENPTLEEIGREIARKCNGLPLAAKALGGVLNLTKSESKWRHVLNNDLWDVSNFNEEVLAILRISYDHLPRHLKPCFLYSSVYPKGYQFKKDELVWLWMAQGLVRDDVDVEMTNKAEVLGIDYLEDLWWSSFFMTSCIVNRQSRDDWINSRFVIIHDLMHDLAQYILMNEYNIVSDAFQLQTLHAPLLPTYFRRTFRGRACHELRIGRTFLQHWYPETEVCIEQLRARLVHLRVLVLSYLHIKAIIRSQEPLNFSQTIKSLINLKHLRYLALSSLHIDDLPESISSLCFLQTLDISGCFCLYDQPLPKEMGDMKNLRHLLIPLGVYLPTYMGGLTNLHTLNRYKVKRYGDNIRTIEMKYLMYLGGELTISNLEQVRRASEAEAFELHNKMHIDKLVLEYHHTFVNVIDTNRQEEVMNNLKPHVNLKELTMRQYSGHRLPSWFGDPSFANLTTVELLHCYNFKDLKGLGQLPFLKNVILECLSSLESLDNGPFPCLEMLQIFRCQSLEIPRLLTQSSTKLKYLDIDDNSTLTTWCRRNACSLLAYIPELILDRYQFHYPRDDDKMFKRHEGLG